MAKKSDISILILDDHKTMLRIVRNILETMGYKNIDEAHDGSIGLDMFMAKEYDLIVSDWNMEPMNGLDLLKAIRQGSRHNDIPFIMVTSESKTEKVMEAKKIGVSGYIVKPFNADTLKTKVEGLLAE